MYVVGYLMSTEFFLGADYFFNEGIIIIDLVKWVQGRKGRRSQLLFQLSQFPQTSQFSSQVVKPLSCNVGQCDVNYFFCTCAKNYYTSKVH